MQDSKKNLTRRDIAARAGVSPSTVSRALSGSSLLPRETIERVCALASEMGYRPNILARRLARNCSLQLGFVVRSGINGRGPFNMSYYSGMLDAVVQCAYGHGYTVSIQPVEEELPGEAERLEELVRSRELDGLIFLGLTKKSPLLSAGCLRGVPFVMLGSPSPLPRQRAVNFDHRQGIAEMLAKLSEFGYKRLFFVEGHPDYLDAGEQKKALLSLLPHTKVRLAEIIPGTYSQRSGWRAVEAIASKLRRRDCVFLANDRMAAGFYRAAYEKGLKIPGDVGVVGCDDDELASIVFPELSTIRQPRGDMGRAAVEMLVGMLGKKSDANISTRRIPGSFVLRKSLCKQCAAAK
ncbi:MAG: hypothetical protein A2X49_03365 [Lentisphaerae bacterium GWF2_52_8]|nr:MAG: hypothetical protein A2X49_03365 [Lentisphaerae bacterium GWF2_52_8]